MRYFLSVLSKAAGPCVFVCEPVSLPDCVLDLLEQTKGWKGGLTFALAGGLIVMV